MKTHYKELWQQTRNFPPQLMVELLTFCFSLWIPSNFPHQGLCLATCEDRSSQRRYPGCGDRECQRRFESLGEGPWKTDCFESYINIIDSSPFWMTLKLWWKLSEGHWINIVSFVERRHPPWQAKGPKGGFWRLPHTFEAFCCSLGLGFWWDFVGGSCLHVRRSRS